MPGFTTIAVISNNTALSSEMRQLRDAGYGVYCLHDHAVMSEGQRMLDAYASRVVPWRLVREALEPPLVTPHHIALGDRRSSLNASQPPRATTAPVGQRRGGTKRLTAQRRESGSSEHSSRSSLLLKEDRLVEGYVEASQAAGGAHDAALGTPERGGGRLNHHRIEQRQTGGPLQAREEPPARLSVSAHGARRPRGGSALPQGGTGGSKQQARHRRGSFGAVSEPGSQETQGMISLPEELPTHLHGPGMGPCPGGKLTDHFPMPPPGNGRGHGAESPWSVGDSDLGDPYGTGIGAFVGAGGVRLAPGSAGAPGS